MIHKNICNRSNKRNLCNLSSRFYALDATDAMDAINVLDIINGINEELSFIIHYNGVQLRLWIRYTIHFLEP